MHWLWVRFVDFACGLPLLATSKHLVLGSFCWFRSTSGEDLRIALTAASSVSGRPPQIGLGFVRANSEARLTFMGVSGLAHDEFGAYDSI